MRRRIIYALAGAAVLAGVVAGPAYAAPADLTDSITATVSGTATTMPTNGILYIYDNVTSEHHTRTVTYYQHDGYNKTEFLQSRTNPLGVVLKQEDIENACLSSTSDASVNPNGGYDVACGGHLFTHGITFKLGGDLVGRFCRKAQPPDPSPADCTSDVVHVGEPDSGGVPGTGQYLEVGNKDHGGMLEVDYYCNVAGVDHEVNVTLPAIMATDYNGVKRMIQALVTRIVLLPQTGSAPSAVLVLQ